MKKDINFNEYSTEMLEQLKKGAFLTVKDGDKVNTMTIGWGNIGVVWGKPIFTVEVRYSRYTYELLENSKEFTVSIPLNKDLKEELGICGTKSGRDIDKFTECELTPEQGKVLSTPIVGECELHYECKVVYKQAMEPGTLSDEIKEKYYTNNDYHVLYYGEIVATYVKEN
ncbi:flavin reductase family protein [Sporosalibacterium faouarense]|uniref:flavin reductase family protein n=1 Tax=Sporosalibacterium faouarense TaxID=516123 RepID=UPI00192AF4D6|nr:flavin reductase family protein [Sporosalibacterium faouarense]